VKDRQKKEKSKTIMQDGGHGDDSLRMSPSSTSMLIKTEVYTPLSVDVNTAADDVRDSEDAVVGSGASLVHATKYIVTNVTSPAPQNVTATSSTMSSSSAPSTSSRSQAPEMAANWKLSLTSGDFNLKSVLSAPSPLHPLLLHLREKDLPRRLTNHMTSADETEVSIMTSIVGLADIELTDIVMWAKALPGYKKININDRVRLLETSWMEILLLGASYRSMPCRGESIHFADDLIMSREMADIANFTMVIKGMSAFVLKMVFCNICMDEFLIMRVIVLLNSELFALEDMDHVQKLLNEYIECLEYTVFETLNKPRARICQILMLLPHLRQMNIQAVHHMFELQHEQSIPIGDLIQELMKSHQPVVKATSPQVRNPSQ
jgi:hypothetical protein